MGRSIHKTVEKAGFRGCLWPMAAETDRGDRMSDLAVVLVFGGLGLALWFYWAAVATEELHEAQRKTGRG